MKESRHKTYSSAFTNNSGVMLVGKQINFVVGSTPPFLCHAVESCSSMNLTLFAMHDTIPLM